MPSALLRVAGPRGIPSAGDGARSWARARGIPLGARGVGCAVPLLHPVVYGSEFGAVALRGPIPSEFRAICSCSVLPAS